MPGYKDGKKVLEKLAYGADLLKEITSLAHREDIATGTVMAIGAVQKARIGYYDQQAREYRKKDFPGPREICSCLGNISLKEGQIFVHAHVTLADREGRVVGGHLLPGTFIFAAECLVQELVGERRERFPDQVTGLSLWK